MHSISHVSTTYSFQEGDFVAGKEMNSVYSKVSQQAVISEILGSHEFGEQFIQNSTNFYLARGHLSAKTDHI
jgi:hypothetical protein